MARTPRRDPWDRLDTETDPAWHAFTAYRDMGPLRSLSKLSQELHKNRVMLGGWSSKHSWVLRCSAWDREQDRLWQKELGVARQKAAKRNVDLASAMKTVAGNSLAKLATSGDALKPQDLARLLEVANRLETATFGPGGTPSAPSAGSGSGGSDMGHVKTLSDEDRRARMIQLRRALDARLDDDEEAEATG